ncbi:hypothetical protein [Niveispirillum sp. KHB5.9]|uniref:hypothetical protein n=1 Tax=Niveispirillum sp. KHB5.9 TaxID=3400269 RepID=UPI003A84D79A
MNLSKVEAMRLARTFLLTTALMASAIAVPVPAFAQQPGSIAAAIAALPVQLRSAVQTGNGGRVQELIQTLSGGNTQRAAALEIVRSTPVQTSAPTQTETVVTTAARIFVNPIAIQTAQTQVAGYASTAVQVAQATGNPTVATQAVSVAEQIVSVNPAPAASVATTVTQVVSNPVVYQTAPATAVQAIANSYGTVTSQTAGGS